MQTSYSMLLRALQICFLGYVLAGCSGSDEIPLGKVTLIGTEKEVVGPIAVPNEVKNLPILVGTSSMQEFNRITHSKVKVELSVKNKSSSPIIVGCHIDDLNYVTIKSGETKVVYSGLLSSIVRMTTGQQTSLWFEEIGSDGAEIYFRLTEPSGPVLLLITAQRLHHPL